MAFCLKNNVATPLIMLSAVISLSVLLTGCDETMVYKRAVSDLNVNAKALSASGDYRGAIGRLESALDLLPGDVPTRYNLAIAYQANGDHDKSLAYFDGLLEEDTEIEDAPLLKAKGIVFETIGDGIMEKVDAIKANKEEPDPCFKEEGDEEKMQAEAIVQYKSAIDSYEKALASKALTQSDAVINQVKQLEDRIERLELGDKASEEAKKQL